MKFYQDLELPNLYIREHPSQDYPPRTAINASGGDVTLALATDMTTKGEILTKKLVEKAGKIYLGVQLYENIESIKVARSLYKALVTSKGNHLNIAGNSIHTLHMHGVNQAFINLFVFAIIEQVHKHYPIAKIVTGGQTGVDIAGAVAGAALGIHTEVTFPKGFRQRTEKKEIYSQTPEEVLNEIKRQVLELDATLGLHQKQAPEKKIAPQ